MRKKLAYQFALRYGPFQYTDYRYFPDLDRDQHSKWLDDIRLEISRSKDYSFRHFFEKYGDCHTDPPIWNTVETFTFGKTLTMYRGVSPVIKKTIASDFLIPEQDTVLQSWLLTLNEVRNVCAHHGRLWNRILGNKPRLPYERKNPDWHKPVPINTDRMFGVLTILRYMLKIAAPTSNWNSRLLSLFAEFPEIDLSWMGFPLDWCDCPIWK